MRPFPHLSAKPNLPAPVRIKMKLPTVIARAGFMACLLLSPSQRLVTALTNPIVVQNYKMFDSVTGKYFPVKGVDYIPKPNTGSLLNGTVDFYSDEFEYVWASDLPHLAASGANTVRLYYVDPSKSHSAFMCALSSLGMYAVVPLDASCDGCTVTNGMYPNCYPTELKTRGQAIVDAFAVYSNVLAFSVGNDEDVENSIPDYNAPCHKKFIRDMRQYIGSCDGMRSIPVGAVVADDDFLQNALYFGCVSESDDEYSSAQWFGFSGRVHCDGAAIDPAKDEEFTQTLGTVAAMSLSIPVVLSGFGCMDATFPTMDGHAMQRTWMEAGWIHSHANRNTFSGGLAYQFVTPLADLDTAIENNGLGYYAPRDCDHVITRCQFQPMPNYDRLARQYLIVNPANYQEDKLTFVAQPSRSAPTKCLASQPSLSAIIWPSDDAAASLTCSAREAVTCTSSNSATTPTPSSATPLMVQSQR